MPDMEKVIDFLQHISLNAYEYRDSNNEILGYPYLEAERIADDALALLREQEPVPRHHKCIGECYALINEEGTKFCPWCGKAVKWE